MKAEAAQAKKSAVALKPAQNTVVTVQAPVLASSAQAASVQASSAQASSAQLEVKKKPLTYAERLELPKLEGQIEAADAEVSRLEAELGDPSTWSAGPARGVALEINSSPERLDLSATHVRIAKAKGAKFIVSTDAHHPKHLNNMRYGILTARRGGLTAGDILNTRAAEPFAKSLRH